MRIDPVITAEVRKIKEGGHTVALAPKPNSVHILIDGKLCGVLTHTPTRRHILNVRAQMRRAVQQ